MFTKLGHVGITVKDIDKSIEFYKALGFKVIDYPEGWDTDEIANKGLGINAPDFKYRYATLKSGDYNFELVEYAKPKGIKVDLPMNVIGGFHMGYYVDSIDDTLAALKPFGCEPFTEPNIEHTAISYYKWVLITDPDGGLIELLEDL